MTLLSNAEDDDSLMRINNPAVAEELLEFAVFENYTLLDSLHFLPQTDKTMRYSMNIYIHGPKVGTAQCLFFQKFPTFQIGNSSNV